MTEFSSLYRVACEHKGGADVVESMLPKVFDIHQLEQLDDAFYLSNMCRRVFRAGLKHSLVDSKWPRFEEVFQGFDPYFCAMLSEDDIDTYMKDASIIRHRGKLRSILRNGQFVLEQSRSSGGFGRYLTAWGPETTVELWWDLKKKGYHLGGNSGPAFLRMVGRETFLLTRDIVAVMINLGVVDKTPSSKKELLAVQEMFMTWREQSGRPLSDISRIVSFTATR